jgi:hypothetical protein
MTNNQLFTGSRQPLTRRAVRFVLSLAAVALLALLPASLRAETLTFRNDTNAPVVIQGSYVVRGTVRRDTPQLVQPGASARIILPGNKLITVYDARLPSRTLFQDTIQAGTNDQSFSLKEDTAPGKVKMEQLRMSGSGK